MNNTEFEKTFNHTKAGVADKILVIGELEHIRRHALRSAVSVFDEDSEDDGWVHYMLVAKQARDIRRLYQKKHFSDIDDPDWCLCKASASLRQLIYETCEDDVGMLQILDELVDEIWEHATGIDLSDCQSCREDKEA